VACGQRTPEADQHRHLNLIRATLPSEALADWAVTAQVAALALATDSAESASAVMESLA
jgi:hypothetical protein